MKRIVSFFVLGPVVAMGFTSCVDSADKKPVGPVSQSGVIPWNTQIPGQGQGQLGQMPQSQYRR